VRGDPPTEVGIGLSEANLWRLKNDQPIRLDLTEFGLTGAPHRIVIFAGTTDGEMANRLQEHGSIGTANAHGAEGEVPDGIRRLSGLLVVGMAAWLGASVLLPVAVSRQNWLAVAGCVIAGTCGCAAMVVAVRRLVRGLVRERRTDAPDPGAPSPQPAR
jgi:hypothetical protein